MHSGALSLQEPATVSGCTQLAGLLAGTSVVVVCGNQSVLSLVFIAGVVLFPKALPLGLSTCATHGLALIRSRQPQLLVCIEPLVEGDTMALICQAKNLLAAPKVLLICNSSDSRLFRKAVEVPCEGILDTRSADAATILQVLQVVLDGGTYRDPSVVGGLHNRNRCPWSQERLSLTARERQVLQLIVQGHSNREISQKLHLGLSTVKTHVAQLLDKMEVRDRTQAAVQAIALKLVPWP